jgi:RHS repeat-associated protein
VPGYKQAYTLKIPLTGAAPPGTLKSVELEVTVAGRQFTDSFAPAPNLVHTFTWDGKDAYGRTLEGAQLATVRIGYTYEAVYLEPLEFDAAFAQFGGAPVTKNESGGGGSAPTRRTVTAWQQWSRPVGTLGAGSDALGGWTIDVHHTYDPQSKTLYMGDGTRVNTEAIRSEIRTVAGFDPLSFVNGSTPATEQDLGNVRGIAGGADGSTYIAETARNRVIRVTPAGLVDDIAGGSFQRAEENLGDGGPATDAVLDGPSDIAVAQDGTVYISDTGNARIRRVSPDGTISTFAGGGDPDVLGDDGPATSASLHSPRGLALTDDGTLYVAESGRNRIRRITPDGRIATAAGGGTPASGVGDGGKAVDATLDRPTDVAIDSGGALYIADADHGRVRKVDATGDITTLAGTGSPGSSGDDGPATSAAIGVPTAVAVGREGSVYVADRIHHVVRRIAQDGTIVRYAGNGSSGDQGDGGAPLSAQLSFPQALAIAPDESLLIGDAGNGRVRRASVGLPGFADADFALPSQDGTEVYQFDRNGRHIRTVDALTGSPRYTFGYDGQGRLASITDRDGLVTTITRDASGNATGIVAPGAGAGRTTTLATTAGFLTSIKDPANAETKLGYDGGGLLQTFTDPLNKVAQFGYDGAGLLTSDRDRANNETTYARTLTADGAKVVKTGPTGRTTTYETSSSQNGDTATTVTEPTGAKTVTVYGADGVTSITSPDGTITKAKAGPDPRWGMRAPIPAEVTTTTPGGKTRTVKRDASVDLTQPGDPFSINTLTETLHRDGSVDTMTYDGATRVATTDTAGGRSFTTTIDAKGRPIGRAIGDGTDPIALHYTATGKVDKISQGVQSLTLTYDPNHPNRVLTRKDAGNHTTTFTYDDAERVKSVQMPGGATYQFGYDAAGNRTSVTMPNAQAHTYGYDALGRATSYLPKAGSTFGRSFDQDGLSTGFSLPGGGGETLQRSAGGRLNGATSPDGTASAFTYAGNTDRLATATRTGPGSRSDEADLGYDGLLLTGKESKDSSGTYAKSVYGYNDLLKLGSIDLTAGADSVHQDLSYDQDELVTSQGPYAFTRGGPAGLTSEISTDDSANDLSLAIGYDATGIESTRTTTVGGTPLFDTAITRDSSGRITKKVETTGAGAPVTYDYDYFADGRLKSVTGGANQSYAYDADGNRTTPAATYTADDQMSSRGGVAYTYDAAGHLATRGADTFDYSDTGELLSATAGSTTVTYVYDAAGRRVSRTQGGATTRYVYGDPRRPLLVTATRAGGVLTTYNYDESDKLFALQRGGQRFYVATDQVGTPRAVADSSGAVVATYSYDAYGVKGATTGSFGDLDIGFAGGIEDPVTKLVRFGFRDYEPASGRWTARDPIYQAGSPNTYEYVAGNPLDGRDPMGLEGFWSGVVTAVSDFFTNSHTSTALDTVNSVAGDTAIGKAAGTLNDGIGKVQQVQEVLDTALELKEASQEPTDPEQAAGYLKCGLKWIKKILPIDLVGTEAAAAVLDKGMEHARDQRDYGTINRGAQSQMSQIEW